MDQLRARAYLDLLTGTDSRPGATPGQDGTGPVPAGSAARGTLTIPLATLVGLSDHPGELPGFGPVDPWLARDLAAASAANPDTSWCLTVVRHEALLDREEVQDLVLSAVAAAG